MKLVIGNQKSYLDNQEIDEFLKGIQQVNNSNVIICPSAIYFNKFKDKGILLGSQNVSSYPKGATTGELSAEQLKSIGVNFSIVGHSERRELLKESNDDISLKIKCLLENHMVPILCVGETLEQREKEKTREILSTQLKEAIGTLSSDLSEKIIIAYEPIWAIGTGVVPTNEEITEITKYIRDFLKKHYNSNNLVLYGGSVSLKNIEQLNRIDMIDGYLIGGASTKREEFLNIIEKCQ